jgi:hypothetical protein
VKHKNISSSISPTNMEKSKHVSESLAPNKNTGRGKKVQL